MSYAGSGPMPPPQVLGPLSSPHWLLLPSTAKLIYIYIYIYMFLCIIYIYVYIYIFVYSQVFCKINIPGIVPSLAYVHQKLSKKCCPETDWWPTNILHARYHFQLLGKYIPQVLQDTNSKVAIYRPTCAVRVLPSASKMNSTLTSNSELWACESSRAPASRRNIELRGTRRARGFEDNLAYTNDSNICKM